MLEFVLIIVVGTNLLSRKIKEKAYRAYVGFYLLESKGVLEMVFCYKKCSDLLLEKIVLVIDPEKLLKFEAEGRVFSKIWRSQKQSIQTVKGQNNF